MSLREPCDVVGCGHEKSSHHSEYPSTGDFTNPAAHRLVYYNCLVANCPCKEYKPQGKRKVSHT